jgi:hypothetical protein
MRVGLHERRCFRHLLRYLRRSAADHPAVAEPVAGRPAQTAAPGAPAPAPGEVLAATRDWDREQPESESDRPAGSGPHAELRAAAHLEDTTDA